MTSAVLRDDDASSPESGAAEPREAAARQRADATFGLWVFIASEAMFFAALLYAYAYGRIRFPAGFAAASRATDVVLGSVNTALLLTSSALVALAVAAARQGKSRWVAPLLAATAALGAAFLVIKGIEWHHEWNEGLFPGPGFHLAQAGASGSPPGSALFFMLYFSATGVHALHLAVGIVLMLVVAVGSRRAPATWCDRGRLDAAGLYWHFVDVVWIFLWPLLYLVARYR